MNMRFCKNAVIDSFNNPKSDRNNVKFHPMFWVCMILMVLICISLSAILWEYLYFYKYGYKSFILGGPDAPTYIRFIQTASTLIICFLMVRPFGKILKRFGLISKLNN